MDLNALMRSIQQGDKDAFATLYTRYNKTVYQIALEATQDPDVAKSVVVTVFREMYQTIREKGPYLGDLYGWLDALTAKQIRLLRLAQGRPEAAHETGGQAVRPETPAPVPAVQNPARTVRRAKPLPAEPGPQGRKHYTEEEAAAIKGRAQMRLPSEHTEETPPKGGAPVTILLCVVAMGLVWVLVGLLGSLGILPQWNLGYQWFNQTVFKVF